MPSTTGASDWGAVEGESASTVAGDATGGITAAVGARGADEEPEQAEPSPATRKAAVSDPTTRPGSGSPPSGVGDDWLPRPPPGARFLFRPDGPSTARAAQTAFRSPQFDGHPACPCSPLRFSVVPDRPAPDELDAAMQEALAEARLAAGVGDVPVGAVVLQNGRIVGRGHNEREHRQDPTAHAEVIALREAAQATGSWRLTGATVVATLEPCPMCAGALVAARVERIVFGAVDPKAGACGSLYNLCVDPRLNHELDVVAGLRADECAALLQEFFAGHRG